MTGAILLIALVYFIFDPLKYSWMPQCIFHRVTGLQCMGCGSQRVIHALLHGDLKSAFEANAFLVCMLPFIVFLVIVELNRTKYPMLYKKVHSTAMIIGVGIIFMGWLIVRNIYGI